MRVKNNNNWTRRDTANADHFTHIYTLCDINDAILNSKSKYRESIIDLVTLLCPLLQNNAVMFTK